MQVNLELLNQTLGQIVDPDLGHSFSKLNAIKKIETIENKLHVEIELIPPYNWILEDLRAECLSKINSLYPELEAEVTFTEILMPTAPRKFLNGVKHIVAVASGKGGVGKSAVASNLAASLAMGGAKVGLIDGDIYGPSQPTIWGMKDVKLPAEPAPDGGTIVYPAKNSVSNLLRWAS